MVANTKSLWYTTTIPIVAALTTTCIPERHFENLIDSESSAKNNVCHIDTSSHNILSEEGESFSISFDKKSWSLKGYADIIEYARSLTPGMSVVVRAYAHTPHGITEDYARKRIENVALFLGRGNGDLDIVPEIVYDAKGSTQRMVEILPQVSRVHEALDSIIEGYDNVLIEQSIAMRNNGLWNALQAYDFAGRNVSIATRLPYNCEKEFKDIPAQGMSVLPEGINQYLSIKDRQVLVIGAGISEELTKILKKHPQVVMLSQATLEGDGIADVEDTGRIRKSGDTY